MFEWKKGSFVTKDEDEVSLNVDLVSDELFLYLSSIDTEFNFDWSKVKVTAKKITDVDLMRHLTGRTWRGNSDKLTNEKMYQLAHSPMRSQMFVIDMDSIPSFVSSHFCRHKVGVEHFVLSNRNDRGGADTTNRWSPVNHSMLINAEAIITMSHKRLCRMASHETVKVMQLIKDAIEKVDSDLVEHLKPSCFYMNGICNEYKSCGLNRLFKQKIN